jgi:hypothetical protein
MFLAVFELIQRKTQQKLDWLHVFSFYLFFSLVAVANNIIFWNHSNYKVHDTFDSFWPITKILGNHLIGGDFGGWFPEIFGGLPANWLDINWMSNPVIIAAFFPPPLDIILVKISQFLIAGVGAFYFLRLKFKYTNLELLFLGLLWAIGTFDLTYWRIFDLTVLPGIIWLCHSLPEIKNARTKLFGILLFFLLANNLYFSRGAIFLVPFHFIFSFIFYDGIPKRRHLFLMIFFWILVLSLNLPLFISLLDSVEHSSRQINNWIPEAASFYDILFKIIRTIFTPFQVTANHFGFFSTLIFLVSLIKFKVWDKISRNLFYFSIAALLFTININDTAWFMELRRTYNLIPELKLNRISMFVPFTLFFLISQNLSIFLEFMLKQNILRKLLLTIGLGLGLFIWMCFKHNFPMNFPSNQVEGLFYLLSSVMIFILFTRFYYLEKEKIVLVLFAIGFFEVLTRNAILKQIEVHPGSFKHYFDSSSFSSFKTSKTWEERGISINSPSVALAYNGIQTSGGYFSQYLYNYTRYWESVYSLGVSFDQVHLSNPETLFEKTETQKIKNLPFNMNALALSNTCKLFTLYPIEDAHLYDLKLLKEGNSPFRETGQNIISSQIKRLRQFVTRAFMEQDFYIYSNEKCLPRFYKAGPIDIVENKERLSQIIETTDPQKLILNPPVLRAEIPKNLALKSVGGINEKFEFKILTYKPSTIIFEINAGGYSNFVLAENFHHDWVAKINETEIDILPVYGFQRLLQVPPGKSILRLEYSPWYARSAMLCGAMMTLIGLMGIVFLSFKKSSQAS